MTYADPTLARTKRQYVYFNDPESQLVEEWVRRKGDQAASLCRQVILQAAKQELYREQVRSEIVSRAKDYLAEQHE